MATWNQWYKEDNPDLSGWVEVDSAQDKFLQALGLQPGQWEYGEGTPAAYVYTPESQAALDKYKAAGYSFLQQPGTNNYYYAVKTPEGVYRLNQQSQSSWAGLAPVLGLLAAPFTGGLSSALGGGLAGALGAGAVTGGLGSLITGGDPLKGALLGGITGGVTSGITSGLSDITGLAPKDINAAIKAAQAISADNPLALVGLASSYLPGPTMPGVGTSEDIQEGFFEPGGPGFMPTEYLDDAEVQRELTSLLGRYPATAPSDWFLGENVPSGIPEWDFAAVSAGLPIGNLEQDFYVAQTKEGPRIVDSAGNVGNFVNGEFVVDTGVTPNLSYASTGTPVAGKATGSTQAPSNAASVTASSGFDPSLLFALGAMMTPQQQKKEDQQMAPTRAVQSPFGMDLLI